VYERPCSAKTTEGRLSTLEQSSAIGMSASSAAIEADGPVMSDVPVSMATRQPFGQRPSERLSTLTSCSATSQYAALSTGWKVRYGSAIRPGSTPPRKSCEPSCPPCALK